MENGGLGVEQSVRELQKGITDILVAIGKIETQIHQFSNVAQKLDETERIVIQLEASAKSAHKRVDALAIQLTALEQRIEKDKYDNKEDKKWLWGFVVGAAALAWTALENIFK